MKSFVKETIKDSVFSLHAQVSPHDPLERVLELLVGGRVAERVDGAVEIAHEVGEHVDVNVDAGRAEAGDDGQDVVRRPASHEGPQDDADCFQGLPGSVLGLLLGLLSSPELEPLPDELLQHRLLQISSKLHLPPTQKLY